MLSLLAEQLPTPSDPSQLKDFLQYGQMGLALAILIVGAGLFTIAIRQQNLNETTAGILRFFAKVMVTLFVVSFLGEEVPKWMERFHPADPEVNVMIEVPPINAENNKGYGLIEIKTIELLRGKQTKRVQATSEPQPFVVHNGTQFHIDLNSLTTLLVQAQERANIAHNETTRGDQTAGTGVAK
jgi:hypothetical protein